MEHSPRRFNRWIFEGMFLGWGALMGLVLLAVFAVIAAFAPEPFAFILGAVAVAFVCWLSLRTGFDRKSRAP